jgi:hypothetical protein
MHLYGGVSHSFTHPWSGKAGIHGLAYDHDADRHWWAAMLDVFAETIAG